MRARIVNPVVVLLLAGIALADSAAAQSLGPYGIFDRYQQFNWQDRDGLPQNSVTALASTRDGHLWVGTYGGAARFDGVRFTHFDPSNTDGIANALVSAVLATRDGHVWLGTFGGGVSRYADGRFTAFGVKDGLANDYVKALLEDRGGTIWIATDGGGISAYRDGVFSTFSVDDGLPSNRSRALLEEADGSLLVGTERGIVRIAGGRISAYPIPPPVARTGIQALARGGDGSLWIAGIERGLYRFDGRALIGFGREHGLSNDRIQTLYADEHGAMWVGSVDGGLFRHAAGRFEQFGPGDGLPGVRVMVIMQAAGGGLWVGSDGGLVRLTPPRFAVYTARDGLASDIAGSIVQDDEGAVWVASNVGVTRVKDGAFAILTSRHGLPDDNVRSLARGADGRLIVATRKGLAHWQGDRFEPFAAGLAGVPWDRVATVVEDRSGALWIGILDEGVLRLRDGRVTRMTKQSGLADDVVASLYEDRAGSIWVGTANGITRISPSGMVSWSTDDGLASNHVTAFHEDAAGALWIGTHGGGLSRLKEGKLSTISARRGLFDDFVFQILEDDGRNLWMNSNSGVWRTSLTQLNAAADNPRAHVESFAYGGADGMHSSEGVGGPQAGWKLRDGTLWFPTLKGVVAIDPRQRDMTPPRVAIESVTIDGKPMAGADAVRLAPTEENLEIQYTALSWSRPQAIRFKYRLEGLDRDWVEAGARRTAYYSHLPPGSYRFRVVADNGEGVWSETGAAIPLVVQPRLHQTWWFRGGALVVLVAAVWGSIRYRFAQIRRAQAAQQAFSRQLIELQERERQRIAAELHDSLGQSLLVVKNRALLGAMSHPGEDALAHFKEIGSTAAQTLEEVRAISYDLRPHHLEQLGLTTTITAVVERIAQSSALQLTSDVDDIDGLFPPSDEITIYRIIQESLNNVLKHARATTAHVAVRSHEGEVVIVVRDDGQGFDPREVRSAPATGGFGLKGMARRVEMLGGTHTIDSSPGHGTTVRVCIDLSTRVLHR